MNEQALLALADRIEAWRKNDRQGYDHAIELVCEAEDLIRGKQPTIPVCPSCGGYHVCPAARQQATPERPAPAPKRGPRELERVFADGDLRVWCRATNLSDEGERQAQHYRLSAVTQFFADMTQVEKAEAIAMLDFVNCVEVKTHYGAVLIYPEWP